MGQCKNTVIRRTVLFSLLICTSGNGAKHYLYCLGLGPNNNKQCIVNFVYQLFYRSITLVKQNAVRCLRSCFAPSWLH